MSDAPAASEPLLASEDPAVNESTIPVEDLAAVPQPKTSPSPPTVPFQALAQCLLLCSPLAVAAEGEPPASTIPSLLNLQASASLPLQNGPSFPVALQDGQSFPVCEPPSIFQIPAPLESGTAVPGITAARAIAAGYTVFKKGACEHGDRKSECRHCGGRAICEHGRRRRQCTTCGGSGICQHGKRKSRCKWCDGVGICEHRKLKSRCTLCRSRTVPGPSCSHGIEKTTCPICASPKLRACAEPVHSFNPMSSSILSQLEEIASAVGVPPAFKSGRPPKSSKIAAAGGFTVANEPQEPNAPKSPRESPIKNATAPRKSSINIDNARGADCMLLSPPPRAGDGSVAATRTAEQAAVPLAAFQDVSTRFACRIVLSACIWHIAN